MAHSLKTYAQMFKALSDETRLKILGMLSDDEICACELLEEVDITQPTLSYHMKYLCDSGLVNSRKDGPWMRYTLNTAQIALLGNFLQDIKKTKR